MQVWQDEYDGIWTRHEGLAGGHDWLMVALTHKAEQVQHFLAQVPAQFKGQLYVLLLPEPTAAPLERALKLYQPHGVVVLSRTLGSGPALDIPEKTHESTAGMTYLDGGSYPAWKNALSPEGEPLPDLWASVCAKHGVPVVVTAPEQAFGLWITWLQQTPLALQNLEC